MIPAFSMARFLGGCPPSDLPFRRCTVAVSDPLPFPIGPAWDALRVAGQNRTRSCNAPMRSDGTGCTAAVPHITPIPSPRLYATLTGTRRNLEAIHLEGARLLVGPDQLGRCRRGPPPLAWALDNGAWGAFRNGRAFDADAFQRAVRTWGEGADWIVAPDIVAGGLESLRLSASWLPDLTPVAPVLVAVQDGISPEDVTPLLRPERVGIFVGGSTD